MTVALYDCDACGYVGHECGWVPRVLPSDSNVMCCPGCGSEDFGEMEDVQASSVFPTVDGWVCVVDRGLRGRAQMLMPDNYGVSPDGWIVGHDHGARTLGWVLGRLADAFIFPEWVHVRPTITPKYDGTNTTVSSKGRG